MTHIKEDKALLEERAKLNRRTMIGGVLMIAGILFMIPAQDIYFTFSFLLWSLGAVIMFPAQRRLSKLGPPPIAVKYKNKRFLLVVMTDTAICIIIPFVLHPLHPRLDMKMMFAMSGILWLLVNVCIYFIFKKMFVHDEYE